jgi:hypothetical protein
MHNDMAYDTNIENFAGTVLKDLTTSNPNPRQRDEPRAPIRLAFTMNSLKTRLRRQWLITSKPALKAVENRLQRLVTRRLTGPLTAGQQAHSPAVSLE